MTSKSQEDKSASTLDVYYNGSCPICSAEISHYKAMAGKVAPNTIQFLDITRPEIAPKLAGLGLTGDDAARRLYVQENNITHSGVAAFAKIWDRLPRYKWLGWLVRLPVIKPVMEWGYNRIAAPWLYKSHLKRIATATKE